MFNKSIFCGELFLNVDLSKDDGQLGTRPIRHMRRLDPLICNCYMVEKIMLGQCSVQIGSVPTWYRAGSVPSRFIALNVHQMAGGKMRICGCCNG